MGYKNCLYNFSYVYSALWIFITIASVFGKAQSTFKQETTEFSLIHMVKAMNYHKIETTCIAFVLSYSHGRL